MSLYFSGASSRITVDWIYVYAPKDNYKQQPASLTWILNSPWLHTSLGIIPSVKIITLVGKPLHQVSNRKIDTSHIYISSCPKER